MWLARLLVLLEAKLAVDYSKKDFEVKKRS